MKTNYTILSAFVVILFLPLFTNAQAENNPLENKILVVTHMQKSYQKGELSRESTRDEIEAINKLIKSASPENIVYSKALHKILNLTLKKIYVEESVKDLDDRLEMVNKNIFVDHGGDIFSSKELINYLNDKNIKQVVIVGRAASQCITTSTLSGLKLGYDMYIVSDATVGKSLKKKQKVFKKLKEKGAQELTVN